MDNLTELETLKQDFAALQQEVATLKAQMAELRQCIRVEYPEPENYAHLPQYAEEARKSAEKNRPSLSIRCSQIRLRDPSFPDYDQGFISANRFGPWIRLCGRKSELMDMCIGESGSHITMTGEEENYGIEISANEKDGTKIEMDYPCKTRDAKRAVKLEASDKEGAVVSVCDREGKIAAQMALNSEEGGGAMVVAGNGKVRAGLKATKDGGIISVVGDDNIARAAIIGREFDGGEIFVVTPDQKIGARMHGNAPDGAGVFVYHPNGNVAAIMAGAETSGAVVFHDKQGEIVDMVPRPKK